MKYFIDFIPMNERKAKSHLIVCLLLILLPVIVIAQQQTIKNSTLAQLQQEFINLRFGMFIHFNIPTFMDEDWADPEAPPSIFNPQSWIVINGQQQQKLRICRTVVLLPSIIVAFVSGIQKQRTTT